MKTFSIEAIWQEMERIKSHKEQVDATYQRVMRQLQTPQLSDDKHVEQQQQQVQPQPLQAESLHLRNSSQKIASLVSKRDMATSMSTKKHFASVSQSTQKQIAGNKTTQVDAETSPF